MSLRHLLIPLVLLGALLAAPRPADAGNYVVYLHGRSMSGWPGNALLGATPGWTHIPMSYDGSASIGQQSIRDQIANNLAAYCGAGNQCVVVCYSAGCARMLDAYKLLKDQGRYPPNILWSQAAASAAGGSELAAYYTKWWVRLLAKIFNFESAAAVDYDIQPNVMRSATAYGPIQNQATSPVYHQAGSANICVSFKILWVIRVTLCGNDRFPGGHGDGAVPVHSAGGYADAGAHASTNDGGAKYLFRAYEQTPLYPADHRGMFGPLVSAGSLRLAVGKTPNCPNMPAIAPASAASIVYDDGDGAYTEESSPLYMLQVCGNDMWNGAPPLYATCQAVGGCCSSFSTGSAAGCTCGETLCRQAKIARRSYYTGDGCTGTEYSQTTGLNDFVSFDGLGMVGESQTSVVVRSARTWPSGTCQTLVRRVTYSGNCPETYQTTQTLPAVRRVYRPAGAPPPPAGYGGELVVSSTNYPRAYCP